LTPLPGPATVARLVSGPAGPRGAGSAAVDADALRESPRAALIAVHMREGNQSEALREFERFRAKLGGELGLEPTARLRALLPG
jgi:SARP family transcriptional regulator, regulator of embCAB operon